MNFNNKKILITGGCGGIGSAIIEVLKEQPCHIIRFDRAEVVWEPVKDAIATIDGRQGDMKDPDVWGALLDGVDIVFHLAAQTSAYKANEDAQADHEASVLPFMRMLMHCERQKLSPAVFLASTVTQYGLADQWPVDESFPSQPMSVYALHKYIAEQYLTYYVRMGVVCGAILRLANVYGPGPKASRNDRGVLNMMVRRALNGEALTVYGSGEYVRDYVMVSDVARAFCAAAMNLEKVNGKYFIVGTGTGHTLKDAMSLVADRAALKTGTRVEVTHVDPPPGLLEIEKRNFIADISRFHEATGWQPEYTLAQGIDTVIEASI